LLLAFHSTHAQSGTLVPVKYSQSDLENLYNTCQQVREDTVNRVCLGFLASHNLRKNAEAFYSFCTAFKNICLKKNNPEVYRRARIIELQGRLRLDSAPAAAVNKKFEALFNEFKNDEDYAAALECLFEIGKFPLLIKNNIQSIKVLFFAEKFAEKYELKQKISYQGILHYTGYILWDLDMPRLSISYFKKSLATGNVLAQDSMVALNALGMNYQKLDSPKQSLYYFNEAGRIARSFKNDVFNAVVSGSAAATLLQLGEVNKAYDYSMQYKNLSVQNRLWENAVDAFYKLVQAELTRNNTGHAAILLDSMNGLMHNINSNDFVSLKRYKEAVYLYYEKLGDYQKALPAYKEYVHFDSLFQRNKSKISELELNAEVRLYEEEMIAKERAKKTRNIIEGISILILLSAIALLISYWYKKTKRAEKQKIETDKINLEQAGEIESLKQQLLDQLATIKNENMNYQALLAQKSEANIEIPVTENIDSAAKGSAEVLTEEENSFNQKPEDIQYLKEYNLTQKEHWATFKNSFAKIYPDFEKNISNKIGTVSGAELRLMMLTKLGLSNKEIAQTLLISPDSVKKGKYRLYKKIGINSAAELNEFL
jgi:DNA-binding CsgD family transcriptional regulator